MIIKEQEDIILIRNILDGNQGAQKTLYDKYKTIVRDYLNYRYSNNFEIDDDVSEIMIKIFTGLSKFDESKSKFKSWVINIAKNYMIDKWRCNAIKLSSFECVTITNESPSISFENNYIDTGYVPINETISVSNVPNFENVSSITYISSQIPANDFKMLNMKYVQGYSYNEIGKVFNLTSSTVSNKVNYLKTKLKNCYSDIIND